jgi:hypothetical protein
MAGFVGWNELAPVPNAFVEMAPATVIGLIDYTFPPGLQDPIFIRPGNVAAQDYPTALGSEWLLYTRSVMSYNIEVIDTEGDGGASLIVQVGDWEVLGVAVLYDCIPFHLISGDTVRSMNSGIELPGLFARFKIRTANMGGVSLKGSIILRGL